MHSVLDPMTSRNSGSCKFRSLNLLVMKSRDPRTHLDPGRNLLEDWNTIDLTQLNLVSSTVGANYHGL
jgi:hypothetical protein